jgi:UDP-glucose 4-epimerase
LIQADLLDDETLRSTHKTHRIEAVVHMAAHSSACTPDSHSSR